MLKRVRVQNYRSLVDLDLKFDEVTVISGANGVGKSNCYKALSLIQSLANGEFAKAIASEGGMESSMWAGASRGKGAKRIIVTVEHSQFSYHVEVGVDTIVDPTDTDPSMFLLDPKIRVEQLKMIAGGSSRLVASRKQNQLNVLDDDGNFNTFDFPMVASESLLSQVREPAKYPFVAMIKEVLASWRFYHEFDTSARSALRTPQVAFWSPKLEDHGLNLASTIRTIWEGGHREDFDTVFDSAFPEMSVDVVSMMNRLEVRVNAAALNRELTLLEVSDGTLRFLCLTAALLSLDKPDLIVLNEPEMSLNESVYPAIAELIQAASSETQVIIVTHATQLAEHLQDNHELKHVELALDDGATRPKEHVGMGKVWVFD